MRSARRQAGRTEAGKARDDDAGEPEIVILPDGEAASALRWCTDRRRRSWRAVEARGVAHWVTTGGSTPGPIYRALAREPLRDSVPWKRVHLWWGDDRWVPPDDPLSNTLDRVGASSLTRSACRRARSTVMPIGQAVGGAVRPPGWAAARYAEALGAADLPG